MSIAPSYRPELLALPAEGSTSKVTLGLARTAGAIRRGGRAAIRCPDTS